MKILATYNLKGGVGKTTAAVNLAWLASREGRRTLLWDLDPQGAASFLLRVRPRVKGGGRALVEGRRPLDKAVKATEFERLDLAPADFSYRNLDLELDGVKKRRRRVGRLLAPLADDYDLVVIDCPPGLTLLSENVLNAADVVLVPVIPTTLSVRTLDQITEFADGLDHRPAVLAFFSMVDRRKRLHLEVMERLRAERDDVAEAAVPALSAVERMVVRRSPLPAFAPRSPATAAFERLWAEVGARLP